MLVLVKYANILNKNKLFFFYAYMYTMNLGLLNLFSKDRNIILIKIITLNLIELVDFIKNNLVLSFKYFIDIFAKDNLYTFIKRFSIKYVFINIHYNIRLIISSSLQIFEAICSISIFFKGALWVEREIWDLFGIIFKNNTNLKRILTDYGFIGHPLKKDFPLTGYVELNYSEFKKSIAIKTVELSQNFRFFSFNYPWKNIL